MSVKHILQVAFSCLSFTLNPKCCHTLKCCQSKGSQSKTAPIQNGPTFGQSCPNTRLKRPHNRYKSVKTTPNRTINVELSELAINPNDLTSRQYKKRLQKKAGVVFKIFYAMLNKIIIVCCFVYIFFLYLGEAFCISKWFQWLFYIYIYYSLLTGIS